MTPIPDAYRETEPTDRLRPRCAIDGCNAGVYARGWCGKHYQRWRVHSTTADPQRVQGCSMPDCDQPHYGRGLCKSHWYRWRTTGDPFIPKPESPYYANLPCPSCGSRATVPFDPPPEKLGRPPSSGLGTCVSCGHTWDTSALPSIPSSASPPVVGGMDGAAGRRRPQQHTHECAPCAASGGSTQAVTDPERTTRGRRSATADTVADGAA